ncbi:MAG: EamA family transporter [Gemmatimonadales bacterium]
MSAPVRPGRSAALVFWSFAAIYLVWGSTYLAIRVVVEEIPPFLSGGSRFLLAGGVMYAWARCRGVAPPDRGLWPRALLLGSLFFVLGNGGLSWAETRVPSGLAALLSATSPVWTVLLTSAHAGWTRPPVRTAVGVIFGLAGVAVLVAPGELIGGGHADAAGALAISIASFGWALGSVTSHRLHVHPDPVLATGMKMLAGGTMLVLVGLAAGEGPALLAASVSWRAATAWVYLVIFGSLIGFSAFTYLLRVTTPAKVSTSAYVNPLVAVALGWALLGETVSARTLLAAAVIIGGVVLVRLQSDEPQEP